MVEWSSRSSDESVLMNFFQQVAAFRATLEMPEPLLLVNVVRIRIDEVDKVLSELDVSSIPRLMVWNKKTFGSCNVNSVLIASWPLLLVAGLTGTANTILAIALSCAYASSDSHFFPVSMGERPPAVVALLRPRRLDRKIEQSRMEILKIHSAGIAKHGDIDYEAVVKLTEGFNGAGLRNVCTEAGMSAIRAELDYAIQEDFMKAVREPIEAKNLESSAHYFGTL
ncbi:hypothetical protein OIU84_005213 [Salix udensis]|uniref:AAA ATPase AAA+ lid domain-containing protein n=1 Tax=Salix udensis TaxID=889485 RepID=A0AAD6P110_9ROSI|nr:hypothetical protein OIU84_005213 [Salix udensis]